MQQLQNPHLPQHLVPAAQAPDAVASLAAKTPASVPAAAALTPHPLRPSTADTSDSSLSRKRCQILEKIQNQQKQKE